MTAFVDLKRRFGFESDKHLNAIEAKIDVWNHLFSKVRALRAPTKKIKGRGRDSNPRRGLHSAAASTHGANVP